MNEIRKSIIKILEGTISYIPHKPYKATIIKPKDLTKYSKRANGSTKSNRKGFPFKWNPRNTFGITNPIKY